MATKRQAPDDADSRPAWKRHKPNEHQRRPNHGKKSFKKAHPVNELKSSIRSLRRLLDRQENLPADVRVEKERALQTAQRELAEAERAKKRSDMIGKYHKIRFFERQKAERRLKKARKDMKACEEGGKKKEELERKVANAEVDLNYALYFPLDQDYVKLWPTKKNGNGEEGSATPEVEGAEPARQGDQQMWELVKKCTKEGTLKDLREGRLKQSGADDAEVDRSSSKKPKKAGELITSKRKKVLTKSSGSRDRVEGKTEATEDDSGDESGGGFFE
ncbi:rRNA-processing EFG1 [Lecanosticta acicola]|uniref:rRNA-processing protein EFG1 n=1 Tax=Lecanosticta acicola TaxID=111012 RepID=A0AAI8Z6Q1_9PEZI|nr:rRNA-processing EFG1 [Lecanosticta acicola]